jgi:hypothetical protein
MESDNYIIVANYLCTETREISQNVQEYQDLTLQYCTANL